MLFLNLDPKLSTNPSATLNEAEQKMDVCPHYFITFLMRSATVYLLGDCCIILGMGTHFARTPPIF